jgi:hypothetical protein
LALNTLLLGKTGSGSVAAVAAFWIQNCIVAVCLADQPVHKRTNQLTVSLYWLNVIYWRVCVICSFRTRIRVCISFGPLNPDLASSVRLEPDPSINKQFCKKPDPSINKQICKTQDSTALRHFTFESNNINVLPKSQAALLLLNQFVGTLFLKVHENSSSGSVFFSKVIISNCRPVINWSVLGLSCQFRAKCTTSYYIWYT